MLGTLSILNIAVHWCLEMSGISVLGYSLLFFWWTSTWFFIVLPEYVWSWSVFTNFSWIWYTPLIQDCFISKIFLHYIFDFFFLGVGEIVPILLLLFLSGSPIMVMLDLIRLSYTSIILSNSFFFYILHFQLTLVDFLKLFLHISNSDFQSYVL